MDDKVQHTFWKAFADSPFIMMKLSDAPGHAEPMTAMLDKDATHSIWFFARRSNRIAGGGQAMGQVMTKGHDVFACLSGTLTEDTSVTRRGDLWNNAVEAWFPEGKDDPDVVLLRFDIADGEVWTADMGLKQVYKLITGKPIHAKDAGEHAMGAV
ncbi:MULTISPECIES: pyridoxamine 5'-phosphate oxidase family protein [Novosphingobium]|uniref:Pyridoxamine 5'-phosphate oxidase family protein n=1 Tax=Novosphingobium decolorationis TaxID=2698673 RepID=A0ABX8EA70_9SPHN|nr:MULTISPECIES: pyridoxamine 5'-phosphate oxidase family protein [Novosphingobium]MED5544524.1 pyridoxamine 5'-phosphate oxidase family protein [Pseudomonadota bacterium]QVM85474.1 pyridoxamine 5'-phosphate oxidase family protein [Novosphingobium decolorationis]GAM03262.1 general stress protein [Novosphingobium sp. MBES04]